MGEVFLCFGICVGILMHMLYQKSRIGNLQSLAQKIIDNAEKEAERKKKEAFLAIAQSEKEALQKEHERLTKIANNTHKLEKRSLDIEQKEKDLKNLEESLLKEKTALDLKKKDLIKEAELVAHLTSEEAQKKLFQIHEEKIRKSLSEYAATLKKEIEENAKIDASNLMLTVMQRVPSNVSDGQQTKVQFTNSEVKGKIIGKDGKNIRAFENVTGTNLILDDGSNFIGISSFDPERREIAKLALQALIEDGRINPQRIEEETIKAKERLVYALHKYGQEACERAGIFDIAPQIYEALGKLSLCQSLRQNVLDHSIEVALLSGMIAKELGFSEALATRAGLLHDIGKGLSHTWGNSHAEAGKCFLQQFGEKEKVLLIVACHHSSTQALFPEAHIVMLADAISARRPGAREEGFEKYVHRLKALEETGNSFPEVLATYAMQFGKEVRIFIRSEDLDDASAKRLLEVISTKIRERHTLDCKVPITLIREKRLQTINDK